MAKGISSFIMGGLIGAGIGLLFAPRAGRETREYLSDKALEYWDQADEMYETGRDIAADAYYTGRDMATEVYYTGRERAAEMSDVVREKIEDARERLYDAVNSANQPVEEAPAPYPSPAEVQAEEAAKSSPFTAEPTTKATQNPPVAPHTPADPSSAL